MSDSIKEILMKRDGLGEKEADKRVLELRGLMLDYLAGGDLEAACEVCYEVGLEPDYLEDLIF